MVLAPDNKGEIGHILSKDKKTQMCTVQLDESLDIVTVTMDEVCLYQEN